MGNRDMKCLNLSEYIAFRKNKLKPREYRAIQEHLKSCSLCQSNFEKYDKFLLSFKKSYQPLKPTTDSGCYDELELTAFIDGKSSKKYREGVFSHLGECATCMEKLLALDGLFSELRQEGMLATDESILDKIRMPISSNVLTRIGKIKSWWTTTSILKPAYGWLGLFFVIVAIIATIFGVMNFDESRIITRDNESEITRNQIQIINPGDESIINMHKNEFRWTGLKEAVSYNLFLLDARGNIIWREKTPDTKIGLPETVQLEGNQLYFWQIEAKFDDGSSVLSAMSSFVSK
jgi:hypothetical protein